jgi:hypothetical protein
MLELGVAHITRLPFIGVRCLKMQATALARDSLAEKAVLSGNQNVNITHSDAVSAHERIH